MLLTFLFRSVISSEGVSNAEDSNGAIQRGKFYYALYDFSATETTMLPLFRGQVPQYPKVDFHLKQFAIVLF